MTDYHLYNFKHDGRTHGWSHQIKPYVFMDLGLPSGKLWSKEIVKGKDSVPYLCKFNHIHYYLYNLIPERKDLEELWKCCKWEWNGKRPGFNVTGPNGNKIFINAKGWMNEKNEYKADSISANLYSKTKGGNNCVFSLCITKDDLEDKNIEKFPERIFLKVSVERGLGLLLVKRP